MGRLSSSEIGALELSAPRQRAAALGRCESVERRQHERDEDRDCHMRPNRTQDLHALASTDGARAPAVCLAIFFAA